MESAVDKKCRNAQYFSVFAHPGRRYDKTVFDLAYYESLYQDGKRSVFKYKGDKYYSLARQYSSDGGHLNKKGRILIAGELLNFLAKL